MTGTTHSTSVGLGLPQTRERIKLRNAAATATALKGECWTLDMTAGGTSTLPLHRSLRNIFFDTAQATAEPTVQFQPYASAREQVGSVPRQSYPHVIADENIAPGRRGWFWLKHPDIQVKVGRNPSLSHVVSTGLPLVPDFNSVGDRRLIWASALADIPTFARFCGWSNQDADNETQRLIWETNWNLTDFIVGETVTGGTSGATGAITRVVNANPGDMDVTLLTSTVFVANDALTAPSGGGVTINDVTIGDVDDNRTIFARFDGEGLGAIAM
jgi:hypothetical protein